MHHLREWDLLLEVVQDTLLDLVKGVAFAQLVETEVPASVRRFQGRVFQGLAALAPYFELVAHLTHHPEKIALGGGGKDGSVNIRPDGAPMGGLAVLLRLPFCVIFGPPAGIFNDGDGVLPAKPVWHLPHTGIVGGRIVEFVAVNPGHRIYHKMIMIMAGITVGRHHHLKSVAPQLLGQLDANLMGGFRRHLVRLKGLIAVVAHPAPQLAP